MNADEPQTTEMQLFVQKFRAGDIEACDELFRRVCSRLERVARKMLRGFPNVRRYEDTGDVLQRSLMRLMRSLQKLEPESMRAFFGLAAMEMRRELLDLARHYYGPEGLGANQQNVVGADSQSPGFDPPAETDEELEKWRRFHEEVDKLPTEEREVVSLVFYHGWKQKQVAELFNVTERTVRRYWQSALITLRESLKGELPEQAT